MVRIIVCERFDGFHCIACADGLAHLSCNDRRRPSSARSPANGNPDDDYLTVVWQDLEIEAYMLWPALVLLGVHLREVADDDGV